MTNVTPAQRRALEAIRDGHVSRRFPWSTTRQRDPYWKAPEGIRKNVIERVVSDGLARVGSRSGSTSSPVELTDAGREALS